MEEFESSSDNELSFSSPPLLNSTAADQLLESTSDGENMNSSMTVQYITDRLIKKVSQQRNFWVIKELKLTLNDKGSYIKKIKRIENLEGLKQLEHLSLQNNIIEKIENLSSLRCLRVLNLSHNMIEKIENISMLVNLEELNLSHNNISVLPHRIFKSLQKIGTLNVSHNNIEEIRQIRDLSYLGNLIDFSFNDNPVLEKVPHAVDTAVFYLRGLEQLNGGPVTAAMRENAVSRYKQDEVNALQDEILGKAKMIDAVSRERAEVVRALEEKRAVEEKLRRSGNCSTLRIGGLEEELANTKQLLAQRTNELAAACTKHYSLEQELSMYKVNARFIDIGPPPDLVDTVEDEHVEESGYVSKAPLYPVQYGMKTPGNTRRMEHYRDFDYTESLAGDEEEKKLLEQQLLDKEREKRKLEKNLEVLDKEIEEKEETLGKQQQRLSDLERKLADEVKLREEQELDLELRNEELRDADVKLKEAERGLREAEAEIEDLHETLHNKSQEVKELRNKLTMTKATGLELEHMQARLQKKMEDLEREKAAYEEARRQFQDKQRRLQDQRKEHQDRRTSTRPVDDGLRNEICRLQGEVVSLRAELDAKREEEEVLQGELEQVRQDKDLLCRDINSFHKVVADKQTETEALVNEVSRLDEENRYLKDQAVQALSESLRPDNEVLNRSLMEELERTRADNDRLVGDLAGSPHRATLRRSRERVARLEEENGELREILRASGDSGEDEVARRILRFLEDRLPPRGSPPPPLDIIPLIKLLLEERDRRNEPCNTPHQDLIKLLEDLIKDKQQPVINVNIPERDDSPLNERYLKSTTPRTPTRTQRIFIHEDHDVPSHPIHLMSRPSQTESRAQKEADRDTEVTITINNETVKQRRVIINNEVDTEGDVVVLDKRTDQATNTNIYTLTEEMYNRFDRSNRDRADKDKERAELEKERLKIDRLLEEVHGIKEELREATVQTNNHHLVEALQRKLDEAITRSNSLVSCGHEELIAQLKSSRAVAEQEMEMLKEVLGTREQEQEQLLAELKIDGLSETLRDHNRSLQEALREAAASSRPRDASRDAEMRHIQRTLLELQYSLKHVSETQERDSRQSERVSGPPSSTACTHCGNCASQLEKELMQLKAELSETMKVKVERGDLERLRGEHTTLAIEMEKMKAERKQLSEVLTQNRDTLSDIEHERRARYHELLDINDRITQSERTLTEHKSEEKKTVEALRHETEHLKKTLSDLDRQREQMIKEAAQTQHNLLNERHDFEEEMRQKQRILEEKKSDSILEKQGELAELDHKVREKETLIAGLEREVQDKDKVLLQLQREEEQYVRHSEVIKEQIDRQVENKNELLAMNDTKIRELNLELNDIANRKHEAEAELQEKVRAIESYKESCENYEEDKKRLAADIYSVATKLKQFQNKLSITKTELGGVLKEKENILGEISRQQTVLENLTCEIATLNTKKKSRKDKLKNLQENCDKLDRAIRQKESASVGENDKKCNLDKEIEGLARRGAECSDTVEQLTEHIKELEVQKEEQVRQVTELKSNIDVIRSKRGLLQDSFSLEEEQLGGTLTSLRQERVELGAALQALQDKVDTLDREVAVKTENIIQLSEQEERNKVAIAELEMTKVTTTNELDEHLNSAIKEKYSISTDITALRREKEQLESQHGVLSGEVEKLRSEASTLADRINTDTRISERLKGRCQEAERDSGEHRALSEQALRQCEDLHSKVLNIERELQNKRSELSEAATKQDQLSKIIQNSQDKIHLMDKKLLTYSHKLSNSRSTLEEEQKHVTSLLQQKSGVEGDISSIKREVESLETEKQRTAEETANQREILENLRKDREVCQKQHSQEITRYNKLMREKARYDNEVVKSKAVWEGYTNNIDRMKEEEVSLEERIKVLTSNLETVTHQYRDTAANLSSVEELRNQTKHLDNEIKQKSEVLAGYADKIREVEEIRAGVLEKEAELKEARSQVDSLQARIAALTQAAHQRHQADHSKTTGLKRDFKKLKKHANGLKKDLVEQAAAAKTLELELQAQRDVHNSVIATLEEDNSAIHSKCEEQLLEIETFRFELTAARHSLSSKQAELTLLSDDMLNKSLHEDMDNTLAGLGAWAHIRNEEADKKILANINYKLSCIESTLHKDTLTDDTVSRDDATHLTQDAPTKLLPSPDTGYLTGSHDTGPHRQEWYNFVD